MYLCPQHHQSLTRELENKYVCPSGCAHYSWGTSVSEESKKLAIEHAEKSNKSLSDWLDELIKNQSATDP